MAEPVEPLSINDLLAVAVRTVGDLLPAGWRADLAPASDDPYRDRRSTPDAQLEVTAPDRAMAAFAISARLTLAGRDVPQVVASLERWCGKHNAVPLVVARYLSPTVRDSLRESGVSALDATGHVSLAAPAPALALARAGLDRDPWRDSGLRRGLAGDAAARVARVLCEFEAPLRVSRLIELSGASPGATYRVIDLLIDEGMAEKGERGWIAAADWRPLLRRWARDWAQAEARFAPRFTLPGGADAALKQLAKFPRGTCVLGGAHAAAPWSGSDAASVFVHCDSAAEIAATLGARPARRGEQADLIVHGRGLAAAGQRAGAARGRIALAAPAQAYADLTLAEEPAQADALLAALAADPQRWRSAA